MKFSKKITVKGSPQFKLLTNIMNAALSIIEKTATNTLNAKDFLE